MSYFDQIEGIRAALTASGVGLWTWDVALRRGTVDISATMFAGYEPNEISSVGAYSELIHPEDRASVTALLEHVVADPTAFQEAGSYAIQYRHRVISGEYRWVESTGCTVIDESGAARLNGTIVDIAAHRRTVDILRREEELFRLYAELASDYVYEVDLSTNPFVPVIVAGSFERTVGMSVEVVREKGGWEKFIHPDDESIKQQFDAALTAGSPVSLEYRIITPRGVIWLRDQVRPTLDEGGKVVRIHGAVQDITERKRLEQRLVLSEKNEALARFSANAARDFDNLLTVIHGAVELASSDEIGMPEAGRQLIDTIRDAAEQAGELTRGMLLFGQRLAGRPQRIEVGTVVGMATPILRQGLGRQHFLNIEVRDTPVYVLIDPAQLQLMLLNLVVNARYAMPTGGQVALVVEQHYFEAGDAAGPAGLTPGSYVSIAVHDTGVGIPKETLPKIFEPFFTTKLPGEGAGLGLAACRGIVSQAGGTITAESPESGGARFTIYLPVEAPPAADEATEPRLAVQVGKHESVLVVDDDPMLQRVFKRVLEEFGFVVVSCGSGVEAVVELEQEEFDIVVSDVVMPQMDGIELRDVVDERWPHTPVLLLSGKSHDLGDLANYLAKPIRPRALAMKIRELLDARAI